MNDRKRSGFGSKMTRRDFLKYSAGASMMMSMPGLWSGCSDSSSPPPNPAKESKTLYLDIAHGALDRQYYLVAGARRYPLLQADDAIRRRARADIPALGALPDSSITHVVQDIPLPSDSLQMLYIVGRNTDKEDPTWTLPLCFFHLPESSLRYAWRTMKEVYPALTGMPAIKFSLYDQHILRDNEDDYVLQHAFKNATDMATAMVFHHPSMVCFHTESAAHIQENIIGTKSTTLDLASRILYQGEATEEPSQGWAHLKPLINPETQKPFLNSHGEHLCMPQYSEMSSQAVGHAVIPALNESQNDPTLGLDITDLDPSVDNPEMAGKIWTVYDGVATVNASKLSADEGSFQYTLPDQSKHHKYELKLEGVTEDRKVTVKATNSGFRFLSLYVRFLKEDGVTIIPVSELPPDTVDVDEFWSHFDGEHDKCMGLVSAEYGVMGIPCHNASLTVTFTMPIDAASALILAGGMGSGSNLYPATVSLGETPTAVLNLIVPGLFLVYGLPMGYINLMSGLSFFEITQLVIELIANGIAAMVTALKFQDMAGVFDICETFAVFILSKGGEVLDTKIAEAMGEASVEDGIPFMGWILYTTAMALTSAEIGECMEITISSPKTFVNTLTFTHSITVTILPDKNHPGIFPETATHYEVTAILGSGTPRTSGPLKMPIPSPEQIVYTFDNLPYGGHVTINVGFYSDTNWVAGHGSTGPIQNTVDQVSFHITEVLVPLSADTRYSHKQKTALDEDGNLIWAASKAPAVHPLSCGNQNGQLCLLNGITVSQHFEAAVYSWQAYSQDLPGCASGQPGQFHQFASMAITEIPGKGYGRCECGVLSPVHLVCDLIGRHNDNYYLDTSAGGKVVRQIRLTFDGPPEIDGPDSNQAWGQFNNPVDGLVLHPSRKLIAVNTQYHKIEVLNLSDEALPDQDSVLAQAYAGQGARVGLVNAPVAIAVGAQGAIYVLERGNRRVQTFDVGINPVRQFKGGAHYMMLRDETEDLTYMDISVEFRGYVYVLSWSSTTGEHYLDIYSPEGEFMSRTRGVTMGRFTVDLWRNVYALNFEYLKFPDGTIPSFTEPSVSLWIPSTPDSGGAV